MSSASRKRDIILDAIRPRASGNFWGPQVASPAALPATGKPAEMRQVLDDGDGKSAVYSWTGGSWQKIADPDIMGVGDMLAATYDPTNVASDAFARANHTGTQTASTISDFDTKVAAETTVAANAVHAAGSGADHADVAANTAAIAALDHGTDLAGLGDDDHPQYLMSNTISLTFAADAGNTIQERVCHPWSSSQIAAIRVGSIGARGTGNIQVEKGMQGGTDILDEVGGTFDVSTLSADNTMDTMSLDSTPISNLNGSNEVVVLFSMINCSVPHLVTIEFERQ